MIISSRPNPAARHPSQRGITVAFSIIIIITTMLINESQLVNRETLDIDNDAWKCLGLGGRAGSAIRRTVRI